MVQFLLIYQRLLYLSLSFTCKTTCLWTVTSCFEHDSNITQRLSTWLANNQMEANHGKCHLFLSTQEDANIQISNTTINCLRSQKLLGIVFDYKLNFDKHIENICQKANRKLNALARVTNYMELPKSHILTNAFLKVNSIIVLLFGFLIPVLLIIKLIDSMNVVYVSSIMIEVQLLRNFSQR